MQSLHEVAEMIQETWKNPTIEVVERLRKVRRAMPVLREESTFSSNHALCSDDSLCWICLFPLGSHSSHDHLRKSADHVIPRSSGGTSCQSNIRPAHRWCNSHRHSDPVTPEIVMRCRNHLIQVHREWLIRVARVPPGTLTSKPSYMTPWQADHSRSFECKAGAD